MELFGLAFIMLLDSITNYLQSDFGRVAGVSSVSILFIRFGITQKTPEVPTRAIHKINMCDWQY